MLHNLYRFVGVGLLGLTLAACSIGEVQQKARNLGDRYEQRVIKTLDTRADMHDEQMDITLEKCEILTMVARAKKDAYFGLDSMNMREALEALIVEDTEAALAALESDEVTIEEVVAAYDAAKACLKDQPSPTGIKDYTDLLRGDFSE